MIFYLDAVLVYFEITPEMATTAAETSEHNIYTKFCLIKTLEEKKELTNFSERCIEWSNKGFYALKQRRRRARVFLDDPRLEALHFTEYRARLSPSTEKDASFQ